MVHRHDRHDLPWHYAGILDMPRRMAYFDYKDPAIAPEAITVILSTLGGAMLVLSALLFFVVLLRGHRAPRMEPPPYTFSRAVHEPRTVPLALNGFGLWVGLMIALTITNYGYPILRLVFMHDAQVPAIYMGGGP
jgi:cytochrome c oxidase subunit 1